MAISKKNPVAHELDGKTALRRAQAFCVKQERCPKEIRDKLHAWGVKDRGTCEHILEQLVAEGFLSEERFACAYARDKFRFMGWGKIKIAYYLRRLELGKSHISLALNEIDEGEYEQAVRRLSQRKVQELSRRGVSPPALRQQVNDYLIRKGYEANLVQEMLTALL